MGTVIEVIRVRNESGSGVEKWLYRMLRGVCGTWFNHVAVKIDFPETFDYWVSAAEKVRCPAGTYVSEFRGKGHELSAWAAWEKRDSLRTWDLAIRHSELSPEMIRSHVQTVRRWSSGYERLALPALLLGIKFKKVFGSYPFFSYWFVSVRKFYCSDHAAYLTGASPRGFYPLQWFA